MEFKNETQFIAEGAEEIIREHLQWGNSLDAMPSDKHSSAVFRKMLDGYLETFYGSDWHEEADDSEYREAWEMVMMRFERSKKLADKKWAVMLEVMGI